MQGVFSALEFSDINHRVSREGERADILGDVFATHLEFGVAHQDIGLVVKCVGCRDKQRTAVHIDELCRAEGAGCVGFERSGFDGCRTSISICRSKNQGAVSRFGERFASCDDCRNVERCSWVEDIDISIRMQLYLELSIAGYRFKFERVCFGIVSHEQEISC